MAAMNFKPEFTVCKTESDAFTGMIENRERVRKNSPRRLHGNRPESAPVHTVRSRQRRKRALPAANCMHAWRINIFLSAAVG